MVSEEPKLGVDFYFDFACPWTYLTLVRLREVAMRTGAVICWKPINSHGLPPGGPRFSEDPLIAAWQASDLEAWADFCAVPLKLPDTWPGPVIPALAGAVAAIQQGKAERYIPAVFSAAFGRGVDLNDGQALSGLANDAGLAPAGFEAAVSAETSAAVLRDNAAELNARGGFASASILVGERLMVGNERIPLVEFALGQASNKTFVVPGYHGE